MTANLTKPRPDITYLRRRLKAGETVPEPVKQQSSLSLNNTGSEQTDNPNVHILDVPYADHNTVLSGSTSVVRLNKLMSAIGSLIISHSDHAAWQMNNGETGYLYASDSQTPNTHINSMGESKPALPEIIPPASSNRPAAQYYKGMLVVGLRSLHALKRCIIVPEEGTNLTVATASGSITITVPYSSNTALYVSVVNNELEFRAETYRDNLHDTFSIGTYTVPMNSVHDFLKGRRH